MVIQTKPKSSISLGEYLNRGWGGGQRKCKDKLISNIFHFIGSARLRKNGTFHINEQGSFRRARANAQSRKSLCFSHVKSMEGRF